jgi:hypothetical protein
MLLVQMDRGEDALAEFRKAGCTLAQAHMNRAVALVANDRPVEARGEYNAARETGPVPKELESRMAKFGRLIPDSEGDADPESKVELTSGERSGSARISRR